GPLKNFIKAPVTVIRPSGKMTRCRPAWTARISDFVAMGLVGSMGKESTKERAGRTHQREATSELMAKVGRPGRKHASRMGSRNETWLATMTVRSPAALWLSR